MKQTIKQRKALGTGSAKKASRSAAETPTAEGLEMDQDTAKFELRRLRAIDREQAYAAMDYRVYREMVEARASGKPWPPADDPGPREMILNDIELPRFRLQRARERLKAEIESTRIKPAFWGSWANWWRA